MNLSDVPVEAYSARSSEFRGFLDCKHQCHPYIESMIYIHTSKVFRTTGRGI